MSTPNLPTLSAKERNENPTMARALDVLRDYFSTVGRQGGLVTSRGLAGAVNDAIQDPSGWVILPLTGFAAVGAFRTIIVTYDDYGAHSSFAYVEIWRATVDDLGQAVKVGTSIAPVYVDSPPNASRAVTYYYWGRIVNKGGTAGPFNATAGTAATTADDPTYMLELLAGEIKASHLYTDLNTRIDLIDGPESMVNSVAYKVAQEAIARAQAILDEHNAWTAAVSSEAGTRQTADQNEAYARETLASQMRGTYEGTDLTQVTSGLVYQERIARTSGDDALAQQISLLYAGVGGGFDPYTTWYFDTSVDGWTGTDCTIAQSSGWVEQTAVSAAPCYVEKTGLSVQGSKYGTVKFRIKRLAGSGWGISVDYQYGGSWYTGLAAASQTVAVGDTTVVTLDFSATAGWTGNTVTGLRVKTSATTADRFSFDWIAIGREGPAASVAALEAEQSARATADSAEVTARETLATQLRGSYTGTDVTQLTAGLIYSERQARSTADSAEVTARQALSAKLTGFNDPTGKSLADLTTGLVYEEKSARVTAVGAVASDLSTLSTTVGGHTTSISSLTTTTNGLNAQYTLKIDNNGFLSGWGLSSESVSGTPFSQFIFQADRFSIINPNVAPATVTITRSGDVATVTHDSHGKATGDYVVIAGANQREYNGTKQITVVNASTYTYQVSGSPATPATGTIKAGKAVVPFIVDNGVVYMDTLLVKNGTIKSAQIESLAVDKLYAASGTIAQAIIGTGHITDAMIGNTIQSTTYVPGSSGWYVNKNGTVEFNSGTFRGAVTFTSPSAGYSQLQDAPRLYQQTTDPIPLHPSFSRATPAYLSNGVQVASGKPRIETGRFGGAIMVEEGATNLLLVDTESATGSEFASDATGDSIVVTTEQAYSGSKSVKWTYGGTGSANIYCAGTKWYTQTAATAFTVSCKIKRSDGAPVSGLAGYLYVSNNSNVSDACTITPLRDGWYLCSYTRSGLTSGAVNLSGFTNLSTSVSYYFDDWQVEAKTYSTTYTPSGTPRNPELLTIPTAGILSDTEGTIELWAKTDTDRDTYQMPFNSWNRFYVSWNHTGVLGRICLSWVDTGGAQRNVAKNTGLSHYGWHHYALSWTTEKMMLYMDGVLQLDTLQDFGATTFKPFSSSINLGSIASPLNYPFNGIFDSIRISNKARSDAEIRASATSGLPMSRDASTTALLDFNTGIEWVDGTTHKTYNGVAWETAATVGAPTGTYVGSTLAQTVEGATINFNARNDRNATAVVAPVVADAAGTIDHIVNTDGSVDVSFEWTWGGTEADIDGFIVYVHDNGTTTPTSQKVLTATADASVQVFYLTPQRRAFILYGVAANHWYTFGVQAYRIVDQDVDATGSKKSAIVQPLSGATETTYGAYRPASSVAFAGDITGTIAGTAASTVVSNAARTEDWVKPGQTTIDGNKIYTGDAYVDTLQIKGQAVFVPTLAYPISTPTPGAKICGYSATIPIPAGVTASVSITIDYLVDNSSDPANLYTVYRSDGVVIYQTTTAVQLKYILDSNVPAGIGNLYYYVYWNGIGGTAWGSLSDNTFVFKVEAAKRGA